MEPTPNSQDTIVDAYNSLYTDRSSNQPKPDPDDISLGYSTLLQPTQTPTIAPTQRPLLQTRVPTAPTRPLISTQMPIYLSSSPQFYQPVFQPYLCPQQNVHNMYKPVSSPILAVQPQYYYYTTARILCSRVIKINLI